MFFIASIYLLSFLLYLLWISYFFGKNIELKDDVYIVTDRILYPLALTFYNKHKRICYYDDNSMSYIPDVAKLAEYIDYKNNYHSVTTPLTIIGVLEEIDLKKYRYIDARIK